ncbi:hypothetical protein [Sorangium sp. So ce513]|uniref:hypothetical protein n=1 Tax=Sorangium sp. So ce513 TaxID=3133315 RepID=UPI003F5D7F61
MRDLMVFTWNLNDNVEAAKLALSHLTSWPNNGVSWIAALQEPPRALDALLEAARNVRIHDPTTDHNVILSSDDIVLDPDGPKHAHNPIVDTNDRMAGRTFASADWSGLRFLAVHGKDRRNSPTEDDRRGWATTVRRVLTSFWSWREPTPLIVAGDLNANPWHREVTDRSGWFAGRPGEQPGQQYQLEDEAVYAVPLVNPMWRLVAGGRTPGTFHGEHGGLRWHCFDQVLVSRDLSACPLVPVIRNWLSGRSLVDEAGKPLRGRVAGDGDGGIDYIYSDHLPVEMILPGEVVARACEAATRRR